MGKIFKQNFFYVIFYSKNYFYSGESQFKSSSIFAAAVSNAATSFFSPETPVFHLDAYSTLHRKTLTHNLPFGRCEPYDFLHDNYIALTGISKRGRCVSYLGRGFFKFFSFSARFLKFKV